MHIELRRNSLKNMIILSAIIFLLCVAYFYLTKPHSYEDCILTYLKSDGSPIAVNLIDEVCEEKFPH